MLNCPLKWYPSNFELSDNNKQMSIQVKFFASLREKMGISEIKVDTASTAGEIWDMTTNNAERPLNVLVAVNLEYAQYDSQVSDGDEVAFFPPVTGG